MAAVRRRPVRRPIAIVGRNRRARPLPRVPRKAVGRSTRTEPAGSATAQRGSSLPAYRKRGRLERELQACGKAFENRVSRGLASYVSYRDLDMDLACRGLPGGIEADFVPGAIQAAIDAKDSTSVVSHHVKRLRTLSEEHAGVGCRIVVCLEPRAWRTDDGISVLPASTCAQPLWQGILLLVLRNGAGGT